MRKIIFICLFAVISINIFANKQNDKEISYIYVINYIITSMAFFYNLYPDIIGIKHRYLTHWLDGKYKSLCHIDRNI